MIDGMREEVMIVVGMYFVYEDSEIVEIFVNVKFYFWKDVLKGYVKYKKE